MRAPYKHNQRITSIIAAAGAVALVTGAIVFGLAGKEAAAEPDSAQNQQIEAPASLRLGSTLVRAAEDGGKAVNLTLDDGPDPRWTPKALELLEAHGAKATFCLTGPNTKKHPDLVKEITSAGTSTPATSTGPARTPSSAPCRTS